MRKQETGRLARVLLVVLAIELTAYALIVSQRLADGASLLAALAQVVAIWVLIRAVPNAYNFALTGFVRTPRAPEHRLGPLASLRLFGGELAAMLAVYSVLFPFERWLVPFAPRRGGRGTPILLVPGFCCNRGYFWRFRHFLESRGLGPVYAVSLEPLLGDIDDNARELAAAVDEVCAQTGADKIVIVGHSMGGLTARSLIHNLDRADAIARIITLGSPHHGTVLAEGIRFAGEDLMQMSRDSDWLRALNASEAEAAPVPILAISTPHDDIVGPQASTTLARAYANNHLLAGIGHLEMVLSVPVMQAVADELNAPAAPAGGAAAA